MFTLLAIIAIIVIAWKLLITVFKVGFTVFLWFVLPLLILGLLFR